MVIREKREWWRGGGGDEECELGLMCPGGEGGGSKKGRGRDR